MKIGRYRVITPARRSATTPARQRPRVRAGHDRGTRVLEDLYQDLPTVIVVFDDQHAKP
jgi:hypothetical protein